MIAFNGKQAFSIWRWAGVLGFVLLSLGVSGDLSRAQTPNPNSYCGQLVDPNLIFCEDFEATSLHDSTGVGGGSPNFGPWYDDSSSIGYRGVNSYWSRSYGSSVGACAWESGEPALPTLGRACAFGTCAPGEWRADNLWQANAHACLDVVRNGEFDDEVSSLSTGPVKPGGGNGVFAGTQSLAHRVAPGATSGIEGTASWGGFYRTFGVTMAVAYATNSNASGIWAYPWKHNEWGTTSRDPLFLFHNTNSLTNQVPFEQAAFHNSQSGCNAAIKGATIRRGDLSCNDVALYFRADPAFYNRSTDWPLGTWGCARGYFQNWGTSNTSVKIWFHDTLVIDFDGLNGSFLIANGGYDGLVWNGYANANQGVGGEKPTNATTYRYEDNIHITAGPPVSCAAIGFPTGGGTPPSPPQNLRIAG